MYKLGFLFCLASLAIVPVLSVDKCYECTYFDHDPDSDSNPKKCKDKEDVKELGMVNCNETVDATNTEGAPLAQPDSWQCVMVEGRIEVDEENFNIVKRFCRPGNLTKADCKETKSFETEKGVIKRGNHCVCEDKDGCNAGSGITLGAVTLGVGLIAALLSKV